MLYYTPLICTALHGDNSITLLGDDSISAQINARRPRPQLSRGGPSPRTRGLLLTPDTLILRRHPHLHFKSPNLTISCKKCNQPPCARVPCTRTEREE